MKKVLTLLGCLFSLTSIASSPYIEAQLGGSHLAIDSNSFTGINVDKTGFAFGLRAGFLFPNEHSKLSYGLETGIEYGGNAKIGPLELSQSNLDLLGIAQYSVADNMDIFAKAGLAITKANISNSIISSSADAIGAIKVGVGSAYKINDSMAVTINLNHVFGNELDFLGTIPVSQTSAMLGLRFTV